jgi:hypothetical protein
MPYWSASPSSKNNIGSNVHSAEFQRDGLYTGAEGEGREHLNVTLDLTEYPVLQYWKRCL